MLTLHSRLVSRHRFQNSCLVANHGRLSTRWFSTQGSLAAWVWTNKTAAKSNRLVGVKSRASALSLKTLFRAKRKRIPRRQRPLCVWRWSEKTLPEFKSRLRAAASRKKASPTINLSQQSGTPSGPNSKDAAAIKKAALKASLDETASKEAALNEAAPTQADLERTALEKEFYSILETGQPDQVMTALLDRDYEEIVATMPASIFVEALHLLSPAYFVEPFKEIHKDLHPAALHVNRCKGDKLIFDDFIRNLCAIFRIRQAAGHSFGLAEYTHLLECARAVGDAATVYHILFSMKRDRIVPDSRCYNLIMETKLWANAYTGLERHRLRITPYSYRKRGFADPGWTGYGTGQRSVRSQVRGIFNKMISEGYEGDETSIACLLLAFSRVGDNWSMERVLKTTWNIDATSLRLGYREEVTKYDRSSPFYPSARILETVAHAFGAANDIVSAGRIIEHISTSYDIPVPQTVWEELFRWSFVLSVPRKDRLSGRPLKGHIPYQVCRDLFNSMTDKPFNVQPTVPMHRRLAKIAWRTGRIRDCLAHAHAAYKILDETRQKKEAAREVVESYLLHHRINGADMDPRILRSRGFADAVHAYDICRHQVIQQTLSIDRIIQLLVFKNDWFGDRRRRVWDRQWRPQLIEEWREFLPQTFFWQVDGSLLELGYDGSPPQSNLCRVRRPSLMDDFDPKQAYTPVDDDAILAAHRQTMSPGDLNTPLLKRLFEPNIVAIQDLVDADLRSDDLAYDADSPLYDQFQRALEDRFFDTNQDQPRETWLQANYHSNNRKKAALVEAFLAA
ncbi:mitochondrial ATPase expression-domain-containing protein [Aspergillus unguis]